MRTRLTPLGEGVLNEQLHLENLCIKKCVACLSCVVENGGQVCVVHPYGSPLWYITCLQDLRAQGRMVMNRLHPRRAGLAVLNSCFFNRSILKQRTTVPIEGLERRITVCTVARENIVR